VLTFQTRHLDLQVLASRVRIRKHLAFTNDFSFSFSRTWIVIRILLE